MKNAHLGVAPLKIGGETWRLCFDWEALASVKAELGHNMAEISIGSLSTPDLAKLVEIGSRRHHGKSLEAADVMEWSPPIRDVTQAVTLALQYAYFGPEDPAETARRANDAGEEPEGEEGSGMEGEGKNP